MRNKIALIIIVLLVVNVFVMIGVRKWRQPHTEKMLRDATRYAGVTGKTITEFDERTNRWLAELREESAEETIQKLTGAAEYVAGFALSLTNDGFYSMSNEEGREGLYYRAVVEVLLSNRRFRKAYEDVQKMNKRQAAELLTKNIRDNLAALRVMLQEDRDKVARGEHTGVILRVLSYSDEDAYRPMSRFDKPPTRMGRKYAVFSYLLLAAWFELRGVRPAVEDVAEFAKEEYEFFHRFNFDDEDTFCFQSGILEEALYNPSLLITAALCDPSWKVTEKKRLPKEKLIEDKVVDYQSRAIEQDKDAREGWLPVVPYGGMLKIRYYKDITDAEFNDFFGK